jgi:hypothetical protein
VRGRLSIIRVMSVLDVVGRGARRRPGYVSKVLFAVAVFVVVAVAVVVDIVVIVVIVIAVVECTFNN